MGKKCKKKVVWKQLPLEQNSAASQKIYGGSYSNAVNGSSQNGYETNWSNNHYRSNGDETSYSGGGNGDGAPHNNRRPYKYNRSNKNNGYKWRRRTDRPAVDGDREHFNEDSGKLLQDEEYTKIETPRQEVLFKKRSLQRRKEVDPEGTTGSEITVEGGEHDAKISEMIPNSMHYDDGGMYIPDANNPTLAGVVVQQLYPGGPMVSIPVHYGQYVSPTLIPGDPALLTLDPSFSRIISADEMEDVPNILPLQLDANGHPITVQVKVDANGVPVEIEPRGFQVFDGNIEEQQYILGPESQQNSLNFEEGTFEQIEEERADQELCNTPDEEAEPCNTPDEEAEPCNTPEEEEEAETCDTSVGEAVEPCIATTEEVEIKVSREVQEKDLKETEEFSSDSQYATMSDSSSPNTPASELSDPSDIPDQGLHSKLSDDPQKLDVQGDADTTKEPASQVDKESVTVTTEVECDRIPAPETQKETLPPQLPVNRKQVMPVKKKAKVQKVVEVQEMSRKQRKKEAKLLKKQSKSEASPNTPPVIIREKASPGLLTYSPSTNVSTQFATKSLGGSLAFLNSPEFSVQQYLKYQGSLQNRCKTPVTNRGDPSEMMCSPLDGFGHIDISYSQMSNDNIMPRQLRKEIITGTPKLKLPSKPNALPMPQHDSSVKEETSGNGESKLPGSSTECIKQSTENSNSETGVVRCNLKTDDRTPMEVSSDNPDISVPNENKYDNSTTNVCPLDEEPCTEVMDKTSQEPEKHILTAIAQENIAEEEAHEKCEPKCDSIDTLEELPQVEELQSEVSFEESQEATLETVMDTNSDHENKPCNGDNTTCLDNSTENDVNIQSDELVHVESDYKVDSQEVPNVPPAERTEDVILSPKPNLTTEQSVEVYDKPDGEELEGNAQETNVNETEFILDEQANCEGAYTKQGYVLVPVLTPYYSPTVVFGYQMLLADNDEESGKFNRKKKRRYKKKYQEGQQQFYDASTLTGNPYITTDDGFVIPVDPSQACHIHSCQYIPTAYPQHAVIDEGFVSAEHTPYLPNYAAEPSESVTGEAEIFGNLQNHERKEIAEVLKDAPTADPVESGDSGVSESEDYNKKHAQQAEKQDDDDNQKQPNATKGKAKKENKQNRKSNPKSKKSRKPVMVIEEPDFSKPNTFPFNNKSSVPDLNKISLKNDRSKSKKNKKLKKGKNKKVNAPQAGNSIEKEQQSYQEKDTRDDLSDTKESTLAGSSKNSDDEDSNSQNYSNDPNSDIYSDALKVELNASAAESDVESSNKNLETAVSIIGPKSYTDNVPNGNATDDNASIMSLDNEDITNDGHVQSPAKDPMVTNNVDNGLVQSPLKSPTLSNNGGDVQSPANSPTVSYNDDDNHVLSPVKSYTMVHNDNGYMQSLGKSPTMSCNGENSHIESPVKSPTVSCNDDNGHVQSPVKCPTESYEDDGHEQSYTSAHSDDDCVQSPLKSPHVSYNCNDEEYSSAVNGSRRLDEVGQSNGDDGSHSPSHNCNDNLREITKFIGNGYVNENVSFPEDANLFGLSTHLPEYLGDKLTLILEENTHDCIKELDAIAEETEISESSTRLGTISLSALNESSDTLSTIEESNEDCSEGRNVIGESGDCMENSISPNTSRSISKDSLDEPMDSSANHSDNHIISESIADTETMNGSAADPDISNCTLDSVTTTLDQISCIVAGSGDLENDNLHPTEFESTNVQVLRDCSHVIEASADFTPSKESFPPYYVESNEPMEGLPHEGQSSDDFENNDVDVGQICKSLGVTKAVEKWIQEITPAKAFISCSESQNIVLFDELLDNTENGIRPIDNFSEPESKNVESNPLAASLSKMNGSERVANCPRELNECDFSRRSTLTDLDSAYETISDLHKYDPSMFSKYYHLGATVETPLSSRESSRDPSSNRSLEVPSQRPSTNEADFQDNFYHSSKSDEVIPRISPSEKLTRLYTHGSCSDMATCNNLQERKESCSKETECTSLYSSGIGSSLASTPLTSPTHLPPVPTEGGKTVFPQTMQTDPQCAIL